MYVRCLSNSQNTNLENSSYVILSAMGKGADFLDSTVCPQIYPRRSKWRETKSCRGMEWNKSRYADICQGSEMSLTGSRDEKMSGQS